MTILRSHRSRLALPVLVVALAVAVPAMASGGANWGFGTKGQSSATVTWAPDNGKNVTLVVFTLPVKAKSAKTRRGTRCTIPSAHPRQVRCAISPATAYGYVDVVAKSRIPCKAPLQFSAKPVGASHLVRQQNILSGNGCS